jgi:DNA-binding HxlR family transcriptional regulator
MLTYNNKTYICYLDLGLEILRKKWNPLILCFIGDAKTIRFSQLQKVLPSISQKILSESLKSLIKEQFICKIVVPSSPPKVEYFLTTKGKQLMELLRPIENWTQKFYEKQIDAL